MACSMKPGTDRLLRAMASVGQSVILGYGVFQVELGVELGGLEPPTPCLQNRLKLSYTVAHLGLRSWPCPLGSGNVGSCCGQVWWSAFTLPTRSSDPQIPVLHLPAIADLGTVS